MALQSQFFTAEDGVRTYVSTKHIASKQHMAVFARKILYIPPEEEWDRIDQRTYDLINNTAVLDTAVDTTIYSTIEVRVADVPDELTDSQSDISVVAAISDEIVTVAGIADEVVTLAGIETAIVSLYTDKITLDSLYADKITLDSLYADKATLDSLYADKAKLDSLYADKATLDSLFADKATLDSLYLDKATLDSLYADKLVLDTLYANLTALNAIYDDLAAILDASNQAAAAAASASDSRLKAWESHAEYLTSKSYAVEPYGTFVNIWTSDGDGTFTATPTTDYSSLHYKTESELAGVPIPSFPADEGLALVARATGNDWEKILGLPLETANAHKTVTTDGVEGDSYWSPIVTSPNVVDTDFTMTAGANGSIVSPTINDGVTITIPDGSTLVIL